MATQIDTQGLSCPEPVLKTRQALASNDEQYEVLVDSNVAKQNITRFAQSAGYTVTENEKDGTICLQLSKK